MDSTLNDLSILKREDLRNTKADVSWCIWSTTRQMATRRIVERAAILQVIYHTMKD